MAKQLTEEEKDERRRLLKKLRSEHEHKLSEEELLSMSLQELRDYGKPKKATKGAASAFATKAEAVARKKWEKYKKKRMRW